MEQKRVNQTFLIKDIGFGTAMTCCNLEFSTGNKVILKEHARFRYLLCNQGENRILTANVTPFN